MKLKIKVTKEILERSSTCPKECESAGKHIYYITENCAIALSLRDIFPSARVYGNGALAFFGDRTSGLTPLNSSVMPPDMMIFIRMFDGADVSQRMKLPETEFEIQVPDEVIEQINIDEIKPLLENHPTLELVN